MPGKKFVEDHIDVVNEEIEHLNKLVMDFLTAVRPVKATLELKDPDKILSDLVVFLKPEFNKSGIKMNFDPSGKSQRIMLDEKLFREVLVNLTQNAIAAMEGKRGALCIRSCVKEDNYLLTVQDNGSGMDEETSSHVFEPYYTTKANGTGLGLTTVYKIIKEFRGDIRVNSAKGRGTVFTITLPVPQHNIKLLPQQRSS